MQQSETIAELAKALAKAQGQMDHAKFDRTNPAFKSKYATLASIWDAARPALKDHGLSVVQGLGTADGNAVEVSTRILHESGEWLESTLTLPAKQADPQGHGSAITYARRYALAAMLGICADDDDDANQATDAHRGYQQRQQGQQNGYQRREEPRGQQRAQQAVQNAERPAPPVEAPPPPMDEAPASGLFDDSGSGTGPCCHVCSKPVDERVKTFSSQKYGRILCREHQAQGQPQTPPAFR